MNSGPLIEADEAGSLALRRQAVEDGDHVVGVDGAGDLDGEALPS